MRRQKPDPGERTAHGDYTSEGCHSVEPGMSRESVGCIIPTPAGQTVKSSRFRLSQIRPSPLGFTPAGRGTVHSRVKSGHLPVFRRAARAPLNVSFTIGQRTQAVSENTQAESTESIVNLLRNAN